MSMQTSMEQHIQQTDIGRNQFLGRSCLTNYKETLPMLSRQTFNLLNKIQLTLVISTSLISNDRSFRKRSLVTFLHRNLGIGNKILWIKEEIAPEEQFPPFSTIFLIPPTSRVRLYIHFDIWIIRLFFSSCLQI